MAMRSIPSHPDSGHIQRIIGPQRYAVDFDQHVAENAVDRIWRNADRLDCLSELFGANCVHPFWYEGARDDLMAPLRALGAAPQHGSVEIVDDRANATPRWRAAESTTLSRPQLNVGAL